MSVNRNRKKLEKANNSLEYGRLEDESRRYYCTFCGPRSGCNASRGYRTPYKNWKMYRDTQYRD